MAKLVKTLDFNSGTLVKTPRSEKSHRLVNLTDQSRTRRTDKRDLIWNNLFKHAWTKTYNSPKRWKDPFSPEFGPKGLKTFFLKNLQGVFLMGPNKNLGPTPFLFNGSKKGVVEKGSNPNLPNL